MGMETVCVKLRARLNPSGNSELGFCKVGFWELGVFWNVLVLKARGQRSNELRVRPQMATIESAFLLLCTFDSIGGKLDFFLVPRRFLCVDNGCVRAKAVLGF